jgi:NADH-quinone oxidoreductase subunit L
VDEYYSATLVRPGKAAASFLANVFDLGVVDGLVNGVGAGVRRLAAWGRRIQTGFVRSYALGLFLGVVAILVWVGTRP